MKTSRLRSRKDRHGFTLLELLVSVALTTIVTLIAFTVFRNAVALSTVVSQRAGVQDNSRASIDGLVQELNMAGYGLPVGGLIVPDAALYGCSTTSDGCLSTTFSFPTVTDGTITTHRLFGAIPHWQQGAVISGVNTDAITIAYVDKSADSYRDNCTTCGYDIPGALQSATFSSGNTVLTFNTVDPPLDDKTYGFQAGGGDLVLISNQNGVALGTVSGATATTLTLNTGDALGLNVASGNGSVANLRTCSGSTCTFPAQTRVNKVLIVTYYIQVNPVNGLPSRMMRQVNRNTPVPVGEQLENLQITYDIYDPDNAQPVQSALTNPGTLSVIKKVNVSVTAASYGKSRFGGLVQQRFNLSTSVAPRNLSFFNSYQ